MDSPQPRTDMGSILEERLRFRKQTAAQVQDYRYTDMTFRVFRNDALQKCKGLLRALKGGHTGTLDPLRYNGKNVLVVGMGPAGFTLAHHLMNDGHAVVGIDGLKIEPLPRGKGFECAGSQLLTYRAPGNIYAERDETRVEVGQFLFVAQRLQRRPGRALQ